MIAELLTKCIDEMIYLSINKIMSLKKVNF
jgi:hypothetical protein